MMYALTLIVGLAGEPKYAYQYDTLLEGPKACLQAAKDIAKVAVQVVDNVVYIGYECRHVGEEV